MRIICCSDTHLYFEKEKGPIFPDGDILLHAGDHTYLGNLSELMSATKWLGGMKSKYKHVIAIAGNHDWGFSNNFGPSKAIFEEAGITYIQDEIVEVDGLSIFGSPWTPEFCGWAFPIDRGELEEFWERKIPATKIDILITHGPPYGIGDKLSRGENVGDSGLLKVLDRVRPKLHVNGHIHEGYGTRRVMETIFVNASICDAAYSPKREPTVVEL